MNQERVKMNEKINKIEEIKQDLEESIKYLEKQFYELHKDNPFSNRLLFKESGMYIKLCIKIDVIIDALKYLIKKMCDDTSESLKIIHDCINKGDDEDASKIC